MNPIWRPRNFKSSSRKGTYSFKMSMEHLDQLVTTITLSQYCGRQVQLSPLIFLIGKG